MFVLLRVTSTSGRAKVPQIRNVSRQYAGQLWTLSTISGCRFTGRVYYFNIQLVVIVFSELRSDQTDRGPGRTVKNKVRVFANYCSCSVSETRIAPEKTKLIGLQL